MLKYFISCLALSLFSVSACAWQGDAVQANKEGVEYLKKQNFLKAQEKFSQGLSESPFSAPLQLNLGLGFDGAGQPEKALQTYEQVEKITDKSDLLFASYFNRAELLGRQKKIPEALSLYQKALEFKPDSIEVKTNIELLTQQQQGGGGGGQNDQQNQDKKDQQNKDKNKDDGKDDKDKDKDKDNKDKNNQNKDYGGKNKPQPQQFKSQELSPGDAKKILQELDRQEQRVRAEYNKKQRKERANGKDW